MKAAVLHGAGDLRVQEVPRPRTGPGEVLVRVRASGVCNSDLARVGLGEVKGELPLVIGHEFCGVVEEAGEGVDVRLGTRAAVYPLLWCGKCETCRRGMYECCEAYSYHGSRTDGGMAEFVLTRAENLVPLPDGVSFEDGAMTEPASVALHALNRTGFRAGDKGVIIGAGSIGLMAAMIARIRGASSVVLLDLIEEKLELARRMGFGKAGRSDAPDVVERVRDACGGTLADFVLEAAGCNASYNLALDVARRGAGLVFMGNIREDLHVPRERASSILRKQLRIAGTWNSSLVKPENEWAAVLDMMGERLKVSGLISHRITLDDLPGAFEMMLGKREPHQKVMVTFPE